MSPNRIAAFWQRLTRPSTIRPTTASRARKRSRWMPVVEQLEDRTLMAMIRWANPVSGD